jgi:mono/diheme cytochrome c family protein
MMSSRVIVLARAALLAVLGIAAAAHAAGADLRRRDLGQDSLAASEVRGSIVFRTYCVLCHGVNGEGNGRAAARYVPPPANLTISALPDKEKERIIRGGGASVGRSSFMPPWGHELTNEQIADLLAFLRAINARSVGSS